VLFVNAGHETTVNLLGNAIVAMLTDPGQLDLIRSGRVTWEDCPSGSCPDPQLVQPGERQFHLRLDAHRPHHPAVRRAPGEVVKQHGLASARGQCGACTGYLDDPCRVHGKIVVTL
jgi:cytochrome P450